MVARGAEERGSTAPPENERFISGISSAGLFPTRARRETRRRRRHSRLCHGGESFIRSVSHRGDRSNKRNNNSCNNSRYSNNRKSNDSYSSSKWRNNNGRNSNDSYSSRDSNSNNNWCNNNSCNSNSSSNNSGCGINNKISVSLAPPFRSNLIISLSKNSKTTTEFNPALVCMCVCALISSLGLPPPPLPIRLHITPFP